MKIHNGFLAVCGIALLISGFSWNDTAENFKSRISGNGIIEATEVEISSKVSGRLVSLSPNEGDRVKKGDEIATLEGNELEGQVIAARGALKAAEARLAELEAGTRPEEIRRAQAQFRAATFSLRQAEAKRNLVHAGARNEQVEQLRANLSQAKTGLEDATRELARMEALERDGAAPGQQYDQAKTRKEIAEAQVKAARQKLAEAQAGARSQEIDEVNAFEEYARAQLDVASANLDLALAGPRAETIAAARGQLDQSRGLLQTAEAAFAQTKIVAPCDGNVTLRNSEPGEIITPGFPIIRIAKLDRVWLRVFIPEPAVEFVKLGQKAEIITDSSSRILPGKVIEISEKPEFTPKNVRLRASVSSSFSG